MPGDQDPAGPCCSPQRRRRSPNGLRAWSCRRPPFGLSMQLCEWCPPLLVLHTRRLCFCNLICKLSSKHVCMMSWWFFCFMLCWHAIFPSCWLVGFTTCNIAGLFACCLAAVMAWCIVAFETLWRADLLDCLHVGLFTC